MVGHGYLNKYKLYNINIKVKQCISKFGFRDNITVFGLFKATGHGGVARMCYRDKWYNI